MLSLFIYIMEQCASLKRLLTADFIFLHKIFIKAAMHLLHG